ncbi:uncharacterized protein LOC141613258 [Silene latifolia]|uniref:uncharacterized protein LOC141613258 n=1 Tax=Silene latifolia TaxID=37657 RepID=UPI003D781FBD
MKGGDWTSYEPPSDCSWSWKKIAHLLKIFAPAYTSGKWLGEDKEYTAAMKERLLTKDRLVKMGYVIDTSCFLCGIDQESHKHLFYDCCFSEQCIHLLQQRLQITFPAPELSSWFSKHHGVSKLQKKLMCAGQVAVVYAIWKARNKARVDQVVIHPMAMVNHVLKEVLSRFWSRNAGTLTRKESVWLAKIV